MSHWPALPSWGHSQTDNSAAWIKHGLLIIKQPLWWHIRYAEDPGKQKMCLAEPVLHHNVTPSRKTLQWPIKLKQMRITGRLLCNVNKHCISAFYLLILTTKDEVYATNFSLIDLSLKLALLSHLISLVPKTICPNNLHSLDYSGQC